MLSRNVSFAGQFLLQPFPCYLLSCARIIRLGRLPMPMPTLPTPPSLLRVMHFLSCRSCIHLMLLFGMHEGIE